MPYVLIAWLFAAMFSLLNPLVYVCESDGEVVALTGIRDGQRIEDGCYVHRMFRREVCSIARCE